MPNQNDALRLIEKLIDVIFTANGLLWEENIPHVGEHEIAEARQFLAAQPKISEDYCQICGNILDGYVPPLRLIERLASTLHGIHGETNCSRFNQKVGCGVISLIHEAREFLAAQRHQRERL